MKDVLKFKAVLFFLISIIVAFQSGCQKSEKDDHLWKPKKAIFKAHTSGDTKIQTVGYGFDGTLTNVSGINSTGWTSGEVDIPHGATVASIYSNAMSVGKVDTITVQIYIDGVLKEEGRSFGNALSANARCNLKR